MQTNYSILNTVAAANADYGTFGSGGVKITGLPAYFKKDLISAPKTASSSFTTLDSNASISGTTITWTTNPTTSITGEVLEVTKAGVTYYGAVLTGSAGATVTVVWMGANGTPATASGYTVTRKGATFTKVVFAAPAAVSNLTLGVQFTGLNAPTAPTNFRQWNYTSTATTSAADLANFNYFSAIPQTGPEGRFTITLTSTDGYKIVGSSITLQDEPGLTVIPTGKWTIETYYSLTNLNPNKVVNLAFEVLKYGQLDVCIIE